MIVFDIELTRNVRNTVNTRVVHPKPTVQDAAIWGGAYLRLDNEDGALTSGELTSVHSLKAQYTNSAADCTKLIHCRWDRKDTRRQNDFEKNWSCPDPSNSSVRDSSLNVLKDLCFEKKKRPNSVVSRSLLTWMDGLKELTLGKRTNLHGGHLRLKAFHVHCERRPPMPNRSAYHQPYSLGPILTYYCPEEEAQFARQWVTKSWMEIS